MRSRSSLLAHILGSHPQICGYSELHNTYNTANSLVEIHHKLSQKRHCEANTTYYLDKILHNYSISNAVLTTAKPKIIFLLREPEATIKSIIQLGLITSKKRWLNKPFKALDYYCSRLLALESLCTNLHHLKIADYYYLESDNLINNTQQVLNELQKWLQLESPLNEKYTIFSDTGKPGHGDPSDNIKVGRIIKNKTHRDIVLPKDVIERGQEAYSQCIKNIARETSC